MSDPTALPVAGGNVSYPRLADGGDSRIFAAWTSHMNGEISLAMWRGRTPDFLLGARVETRA